MARESVKIKNQDAEIRNLGDCHGNVDWSSGQIKDFTIYKKRGCLI